MFVNNRIRESLNPSAAGEAANPAQHRDAVSSGAERSAAAKDAGKRVAKRGLDIACVCLALPLWGGVMIIVSLWIKLVSRGPIFYRQERVGYRTKPFMLYKFRSMKKNAGTVIHENYLAELIRQDRPMQKLDGFGDDRLILGAGFLRAAGLDELPQLINILRGEMSLVGPRPCTPHEFSHYEPWQRRRVGALPGLTGYWQVNGKNKTTFNEMIALDLFYIDNFSIALDLHILARTVSTVFNQVIESNGRRGCNQVGGQQKETK